MKSIKARLDGFRENYPINAPLTSKNTAVKKANKTFFPLLDTRHIFMTQCKLVSSYPGNDALMPRGKDLTG